ncbi:MAG: tyrosine phosphatase family protein [Phenylobacterium sp.]|uniref:tyrosine phosphatase family protein n=1 Tax=Phenylobacterium sp. TaxID=1871053 RepID=UPI00391DCAD1
MTIIVCGLGDVAATLAARRPSHMVTLLDPATMIATPGGLQAERHLKLAVNDIAEPAEGLVLPSEEVVRQLLEFGRGWDEAAPMLIHCWAGISRSTASAFVLACERNPEADEAVIAAAMRQAAPHAYPNRRIVALADDMLGRRGRMVDAVEAMGDYDYLVAAPFDFAVRY